VRAEAADCAQRLATAEAAAAQAIEAATQAAANTAAALRMELERQPRGPSRSPVRHRIPSPPCRREGRRGSPTAIQTVYKDSDTGTPWPMLTKTNYHKWSLLMKDAGVPALGRHRVR
jgi:hypothetical protein